MPGPISYDYATIRIVPRVDRQEFVNVGVIVFSRELDLLVCRFDMDLQRLSAFAPRLDIPAVRKQLSGIEQICTGDPAAGYYATLSKSERFNWIVAPASHMIQASAVHSGIFPGNAEGVLTELFNLLVS